MSLLNRIESPFAVAAAVASKLLVCQVAFASDCSSVEGCDYIPGFDPPSPCIVINHSGCFARVTNIVEVALEELPPRPMSPVIACNTCRDTQGVTAGPIELEFVTSTQSCVSLGLEVEFGEGVPFGITAEAGVKVCVGQARSERFSLSVHCEAGTRRRARYWVCEVPIRYRVEYDVVRWFDVEPSEQQQGCPNPPSGVIERTCGRGTVVGRRKEFIYELVAEPMDCDGWRGNADGAER